MPRKPKNASPPEWLEPLKEWMREARLAMMSNGLFDEAETLRLLVRTRGDESARLKRLAEVSAVGLNAPQQEYEAQIQAAFDRMVAKADGAERKKMLAEHARLTKEIEERRMDAERARMAAEQRARGDELARLMRFFMRRSAPAALPSADASRPPLKQPPPDRAELLLPALKVEQKRRAILDDLPDDKRRQICAAGTVIHAAYHAHWHPTRLERGGPHDLNHPGDVVGIERARIHDESKAHAVAVAAKTLGVVKASYGVPRFRLVRSLVLLVTGGDVPVEKLREFWKRLA